MCRLTNETHLHLALKGSKVTPIGDEIVAFQLGAFERPSYSASGFEKPARHRAAIMQFGHGETIHMLNDLAAVEEVGACCFGCCGGKRGEPSQEGFETTASFASTVNSVFLTPP